MIVPRINAREDSIMSRLRDQLFTILDTETVSSAIDREHLDLLGVISPTTVTVTVHGCDTSGGTFAAVEDTAGDEISLTLTADKPRSISLDALQAARHLKLVAASAVAADVPIRPVFRDLSR